MRGGKKGIFHEPTVTQLQPTLSPRLPVGLHPASIPSLEGMEGQQDPHAGLGGHIPALAITFCSPGCLQLPWLLEKMLLQLLSHLELLSDLAL